MSRPWTDIPGYDGYAITEDGRVVSLNHNWRGYGIRELTQHPNASGYPSVRLTCDNKRQRVAVHRLMAVTFLGAKRGDHQQVRHLDGSKDNNRIDNLALGSAKDNADDRRKHGRWASQWVPPRVSLDVYLLAPEMAEAILEWDGNASEVGTNRLLLIANKLRAIGASDE